MKAILAYGPSLRTEIERIIGTERTKLGPDGSWQADFLNRLLPYATAGKLLRGNLICFSYEVFSGRKPDQATMQTAAALELIHSALLMHDDIIDNDDFRRGEPSMHRQYAAAGRQQNVDDPNRFGINMAICAADSCLFMAFKLLSGHHHTVGELFSEVLVKVCDGQMQDIYYQASPKSPPKKDIYDLMRSKTASYTLSLPLAIGATLAGRPQTFVRKLRHIGEAAGVIFQIRDDELGVLGDADKTGKPVGADIREDKKTLIRYYLMKACDKHERQQLLRAFGNPNLGADDIASVQKLIRRREIPSLLDREIHRLERKALNTLETLDLSRQYKTEFKALIAFCAERHV